MTELLVGNVSTSQVAIFLLNTPMVAWDPNAKPRVPGEDAGLGRWTWGYDFWSNRTLGALDTWGAAFPHVFMVWGAGVAEKYFFGNHSTSCSHKKPKAGRRWTTHR